MHYKIAIQQVAPGQWAVSYRGRQIVEASPLPLVHAARALLEAGIACSDDTIGLHYPGQSQGALPYRIGAAATMVVGL